MRERSFDLTSEVMIDFSWNFLGAINRLKAMKSLLGEELTKKFWREKQLGSEFTEELTNYLMKLLLARCQDFPHLKSINPVDFWRTQVDRAISFVQYIAELFEPGGTQLALKNEALFWDDDMHYNRSKMRNVYSRKNVEALRFQMVAILQLAWIAAHLDIRTRERRLDSTLRELQDLLDDQLWAGDTGYTERHYIYTLHFDQTNEVLKTGFSGPTEDPSELPVGSGTHIKRREVELRRVRRNLEGGEEFGDMLVLCPYDKHKKKWSSQLSKALNRLKAMSGMEFEGCRLENGAVIADPRLLVQDTMRIGFYPIVSDVDKAIRFHNFIERMISSQWKERISHILENSVTQSGKSGVFVRRSKIYLVGYGSTTPIEMTTHTYPGFMDCELKTGILNTETGEHSGLAHDLYEIDRARAAYNYLFPINLFPAATHERYVHLKIEIARRLKELYRA